MIVALTLAAVVHTSARPFTVIRRHNGVAISSCRLPVDFFKKTAPLQISRRPSVLLVDPVTCTAKYTRRWKKYLFEEVVSVSVGMNDRKHRTPQGYSHPRGISKPWPSWTVPVDLRPSEKRLFRQLGYSYPKDNVIPGGHPLNAIGCRRIALDYPDPAILLHGTDTPWSIGYQSTMGCIQVSNADLEALREHGLGPETVIYTFPYR